VEGTGILRALSVPGTPAARSAYPARRQLAGTPTGGIDGKVLLRLVPWEDPLADVLGYDTRSWYVEHFWLAVVGPTGTWLLRRIAEGFERHPEGFDIDLKETARALGLGDSTGRNSPIGRTIHRFCRFEIARPQSPSTLAVRRRLPPMPRRLLLRLPAPLQELHDEWCKVRLTNGTLDEERRRGRTLALDLFDIGFDPEAVEIRLVKWNVHPSLAHEVTEWAKSMCP
jgi:hypothetical protein